MRLLKKRNQNNKKSVDTTSDTSWNEVSDWYIGHLQDNDSYHAQVVIPNLLHLIGRPQGRVLDIGCGNGFVTEHIAAEGGEVVGCDAAPDLIAAAEKNPQAKAIYQVENSEKLTFADQEFDTVVCILALQNMRALKSVFAEVSRVLKPGGKFYFVLNHPVLRVPKQSIWGFDENTQTQYRRIDEYMSEREVLITMHPGSERSVTTPTFHRPLQTYVKFLQKEDLAIVRLEEWISHKKSQAGPRQKAEDKARHEIPLFMAFECQKLSKGGLK